MFSFLSARLQLCSVMLFYCSSTLFVHLSSNRTRVVPASCEKHSGLCRVLGTWVRWRQVNHELCVTYLTPEALSGYQWGLRLHPTSLIKAGNRGSLTVYRECFLKCKISLIQVFLEPDDDSKFNFDWSGRTFVLMIMCFRPLEAWLVCSPQTHEGSSVVTEVILPHLWVRPFCVVVSSSLWNRRSRVRISEPELTKHSALHFLSSSKL